MLFFLINGLRVTFAQPYAAAVHIGSLNVDSARVTTPDPGIGHVTSGDFLLMVNHKLADTHWDVDPFSL